MSFFIGYGSVLSSAPGSDALLRELCVPTRRVMAQGEDLCYIEGDGVTRGPPVPELAVREDLDMLIQNLRGSRLPVAQMEALRASCSDLLTRSELSRQILAWQCPVSLMGDTPIIRWCCRCRQMGRIEHLDDGPDGYSRLILLSTFSCIEEALENVRWAVCSGQLTAGQGAKVLQQTVQVFGNQWVRYHKVAHLPEGFDPLWNMNRFHSTRDVWLVRRSGPCCAHRELMPGSESPRQETTLPSEVRDAIEPEWLDSCDLIPLDSTG